MRNGERHFTKQIKVTVAQPSPVIDQFSGGINPKANGELTTALNWNLSFVFATNGIIGGNGRQNDIIYQLMSILTY
jgi:hypothetical protein